MGIVLVLPWLILAVFYMLHHWIFCRWWLLSNDNCSYREILLPGIGIGIFTLSSRNNFCDIVTCHKSVKNNIELCNLWVNGPKADPLQNSALFSASSWVFKAWKSARRWHTQSGRTMTVAENLDFKWMWGAWDHLSSLRFTVVESLQSTISNIEKTLISPSINIQKYLIIIGLRYCISLHSLDFNLSAKPAYEWVS